MISGGALLFVPQPFIVLKNKAAFIDCATCTN
jgi:hypothetical protein